MRDGVARNDRALQIEQLEVSPGKQKEKRSRKDETRASPSGSII